MKFTVVSITLFVGLVLAHPCTGQPSFIDDRDGMDYGTVTIGEQVWMTSNLNYAGSVGSRCHSDNPEHCTEYGRLYRWRAALEACPSGWRLPSEDDWRQLEKNLGIPDSLIEETRYRGTNEGSQLKVGGSSGFEGKLAGYVRPDGTPRRMGQRAAFWSSTLADNRKAAWHRDLSTDPRIYRSPVDTVYFLSVRCVHAD